MKHLKWKLVGMALFAVGTSASAQSLVGGSVAAINTLSNTLYTTSHDFVGALGQTDATIVTGQIDNNSLVGWKLTVQSANAGKFVRVGGTAVTGSAISYNDIKFVKTGGTLGAGLTDPDGSVKAATTTGTVYNTGTAVGTPGAATTATVAYQFALRVSWAPDTTLLEGTYRDTITLTLANDS